MPFILPSISDDMFQSVLIVGAGSSACDIGREIALVAKRVYQSVRSNEDAHTRAKTPWEKVVRSIFPDNFLQVPEIASFGPSNAFRDIADAEIILVDNTSLNGIDFVIFRTGYRFSLPFLPSYRGETVNLETIITNGVQLHNLHKDTFFIEDPTLAFVGVPFEITTFAFLTSRRLQSQQLFQERHFCQTSKRCGRSMTRRSRSVVQERGSIFSDSKESCDVFKTHWTG